jgi:hypothetical protein
MTSKRIVGGFVALLLAAALFYFYAGHETPAGQAPLASVTPETLGGIASAFNQATSDTRLLVLLSPT